MSPVSGLLFDKMGPRLIAIVGLSALTGALAALTFVGPNTHIPFLIVIYMIQSFGLTLANMPVTTWGHQCLRK